MCKNEACHLLTASINKEIFITVGVTSPETTTTHLPLSCHPTCNNNNNNQIMKLDVIFLDLQEM